MSNMPKIKLPRAKRSDIPLAIRQKNPEYCVMVRVLEKDMMTAIRTKAKRDNTSVAEAVRTLLTWGLEQEELL